MFGIEKIRDAIKRIIIDKDRSQQRLLGFDIMRGRTKLRFWFANTGELRTLRHGLSSVVEACLIAPMAKR